MTKRIFGSCTILVLGLSVMLIANSAQGSRAKSGLLSTQGEEQ